jgi:hypothetical protein
MDRVEGGRSESFGQAKAAVMLEGISEENTPRLVLKKGIIAEDLFLIALPHE